MVAHSHAATYFVLKKSEKGCFQQSFSRTETRALARRIKQRAFTLSCLLLLSVADGPSFAASNKVRITQLGDITFGTIANLSTDATRSESVCLFADTATNGYNITAAGTGPGGAFQLSSGLSSMPYEVQWSSTPAQSSGTQLAPNLPLTGQASAATQQTCNNGPATTASLIIVLRTNALASATAGTYNGTLTLVVGPE
jgi:hypothetical protein